MEEYRLDLLDIFRPSSSEAVWNSKSKDWRREAAALAGGLRLVSEDKDGSDGKEGSDGTRVDAVDDEPIDFLLRILSCILIAFD